MQELRRRFSNLVPVRQRERRCAEASSSHGEDPTSGEHLLPPMPYPQTMSDPRRILPLLWITAAVFTTFAQAQAQDPDPAKAFFTAPENTLAVSELGIPFEMVWGDHRVGERIIERAFLMVPVVVEGIEDELFLQFDLGAPSTVLYGPAVDSVIERGGMLPAPNPGETSVSNVRLQVGTTRVSARSLEVLGHGSSIDWEDTDARRVLGTLGADWIDGRVLVLDYPRNRLQLCPKMPAAFAERELEPFSFRGRRIFLPAEIDGQAGRLWFDTGSSAFELITDEESFRAMALDGAEEDVYPAQSWGQPIKVHDIAADSKIVLGLTEIPLTRVSFIEWPDPRMVETMTQALGGSNLGGMCGNQLFTNHTLILDADGDRFWVGDQGR